MALEARSTVSLILSQVQAALKLSVDPNLPVVYDQDLSIETAVGKDRQDRTLQTRLGKSGSILAYRRSVLKPRNDNLRLRGLSGKNVVSANLAEGVISSQCEFDFEFSYFTKDIRKMEVFELTYAARLQGSASTNVSVDLGTLGVFEYQVTWNPLTELDIGITDSYNQSLSGSAKIEGIFFIVTPAVAGVINTIDTTISDITGIQFDVVPNPRARGPI